MSKSSQQSEAKELRKQGKSVRDIAKELSVSKSSASLWTRDIALTIEQIEKLRQNSLKGSERARLQHAIKLKNTRLELIEAKNNEGETEFGSLNVRELDIAGLCLYWSEGSKKNRRIELCNSDPKLIRAFMKWLTICYQIPW
jgi:transcriptional regulator with XRE-family HTH domain